MNKEEHQNDTLNTSSDKSLITLAGIDYLQHKTPFGSEC